MKKGKKYLALLLAAVVATGSLQIPACAETKNESSVQKETGEEIGVQMQQLKEESGPLTLLDLSLEGVEAAELTEDEFATKFNASQIQIEEADREMCADLGPGLQEAETGMAEQKTVSVNDTVSSAGRDERVCNTGGCICLCVQPDAEAKRNLYCQTGKEQRQQSAEYPEYPAWCICI